MRPSGLVRPVVHEIHRAAASRRWQQASICPARPAFGNAPNVALLEIGEGGAWCSRDPHQCWSDQGLTRGFQMTGKGLKIVMLSALTRTVAMLVPGLEQAAVIT